MEKLKNSSIKPDGKANFLIFIFEITFVFPPFRFLLFRISIENKPVSKSIEIKNKTLKQGIEFLDLGYLLIARIQMDCLCSQEPAAILDLVFLTNNFLKKSNANELPGLLMITTLFFFYVCKRGF